MRRMLALLGVVAGCDLYWPNPRSKAPAGESPADAGWTPTPDAYVVDAGEDAAGDARPDASVTDAFVPADAAVDAFVPVDAAVDAAVQVTPCDLFASHVDFPTGSNPMGIAVADFNLDGLPDIAVLDFSSGKVSIHLDQTPVNATTPRFSAATDFAIGRYLTVFAAGDINNDGAPDLVIPGGDHTVTLLVNKTAAGRSTVSFATVPLAADEGTGPVALVDVNRDGRLDIAVASDIGTGNQSVSVYLNTTPAGVVAPAFAPFVDFPTGRCMGPVASADFNGDGIADLAAVTCHGTADPSTVSILLGTSAPQATVPSFRAAVELPSGRTAMPVALTVADVNSDWRPDVATVTNDQMSNSASGDVLVAVNETGYAAAAPVFGSSVAVARGPAPSSVIAADVDGDGAPDLVAAYQALPGAQGSLSILHDVTATNATTPRFAACETLPSIEPTGVAVADFNGDGKPDLATANGGSTTNSFSVYLRK